MKRLDWDILLDDWIAHKLPMPRIIRTLVCDWFERRLGA